MAALDGNRNPVQLKTYTMPDASQAPGHVIVDPATGNPYSVTDPPPLPTGAAQDGTDAAGVTPAAGAAGLRGWLSTIAKYLTPGQQSKSASVPVTLPNDPDLRPAAGTITAADSATSSSSGQSSVGLVSGAPTAGSFLDQAINGQSTLEITVTGTWSATLVVEASANGGLTYVPAAMHLRGSSDTLSSLTGNAVLVGSVSGLTNVRVRATAYTSGTASVQMAFGGSAGAFYLLNPLRLYDGVSRVLATIKAASTAATTADTGLVVAVRPDEIGTPGSGISQPTGGASLSGWLSGLYADLGAPGATACATDTGSCSANALLQRIAQRLTTLNATLGSPIQAGASLAPLAVTPTDRGGTITTGGTAQNAAASNGSRKAAICQNPASATEDLFIAVAGAATVGGAGNFADLLPGGSATLTISGTVITAAISVNAATTGHRFYCTEVQ